MRPVLGRRPFVILAVLGVVLITASVLLGRGYYEQQRSLVQAQMQSELAAIGKLKVGQISDWRARLLASAGHLGADSLASPEVSRWLQSGAASAQILAWLSENAESGDLESILLIDPTTGRYLSTSSAGPSAHDREEASAAALSGTASLSEPYRDETGAIRLDIAVPMTGVAAPAVLIMRADPARFLFPVVQSWPTPSDTAETLLVRRQGDKVLFLNDLRFSKDAALSLTVPMSSTDVLGVQAVQGKVGVRTGRDYRGAAVLGAIEKVQGTDWYLVAKIDETEAYAPVRAAAGNAIVGAGLLVLLVSAGIGAAWRSQLATHYREQAALAERYAFLSRNANDSVMLLDSDLRIREVNDHAVRTYGYTHEELLGMSLSELRGPSARDAVVEDFERLREAGGSSVFETVHRRRDGSTLPVEVSVRVQNSAGKMDYVSVIRDITERKAIERELEVYRQHLEALVDDRTQELTAANEELRTTNDELQAVNEELISTSEELQATNEELTATNEELSVTSEDLAAANRDLHVATRAKSEFLANMSHELRTPLNSIIGFTGVMLQGLTGRLTEEQRSQLGMVRRSGNRLLALINDILDLSRIESGRAVVRVTDVDLRVVARACLETVRPLATKRGLRVAIESLPDDTLVVTDEQKLHQVLVNLLANAIKFTDAGSVTLRVEAVDERHVAFEVRDTGVGIAQEDLAAIFDEFVQVDRDGGKPDGTGLGLAISRRLADLLGGTLSAASVVGEGSVFRLTIPRSYRGEQGVGTGATG